MRNPLLRLTIPLALLAVTVSGPRAQGTPVGFLERFALAEDRAAVLEELVPGTPQHYFFACLERQHEGDLAAVDRLLKDWVERFGTTNAAREIQHRNRLLRYGTAPEPTIDYLIRELGLSFGDERQRQGARPELPTRLDPALIDPVALSERALKRHPRTVDGFAPHALGRVAGVQIGERRLSSLIGKLRRPDFPNLPALVLQDLRNRRGSFGDRVIHARLTLSQLEDCARARPELLRQDKFVRTWLQRIAPRGHEDWQRDAGVREQVLQRVEAFVDRLEPVFNSLKAHVLYHRLQHDLGQGRVVRERVRRYMRLPRPFGYVRDDLLSRANRAWRVDPRSDYGIGLRPIGNDEKLVRECLAELFVDASSFDTWSELVDEDWLKKLFVETKLLRGVGDPNQWVQLVDDPSWYEALRQRIEIDFPRTRKQRFGADDAVAIDVIVKNVDTLIVKVFEIDAFNYYRSIGSQSLAGLDLDGLVANEERQIEFGNDPLRQNRRRILFPSLQGEGLWVLEFLGNGRASRVVVRKGDLVASQRLGSAGHVFQVRGMDGRVLRDASVWFGGRSFEANDTGEIVVPFSTESARDKKAILRSGKLAATHEFRHLPENYNLRAQFHVERESLLDGEIARLVVRPELRLNGKWIDPSLLENTVVQLRATDLRGRTTNLDVRNPELSTQGEFVHEFRVPRNLQSLWLQLTGSIDVVTTGKPQSLRSSSETFEVNQIDRTDRIFSSLLSRTADGYSIELRGKDGEVLTDQTLQVVLGFEDFTDELTVTLRSDENGRVGLGLLEGVSRLRCAPQFGYWYLTPSWLGPRQDLTFRSDTEMRLSLPDQNLGLNRQDLALFSLDAKGNPLLDRFDALSIQDGFLVVRDLAAGRYELTVRREQIYRTKLQVVDAEPVDGVLQQGARFYVQSDSTPLQVSKPRIDGEDLVVQVQNAGPRSRVHLALSRYVPRRKLRDVFRPRGDLDVYVPWATDDETTYYAGRAISDEYRYILERRLSTKFPGSMLERPGLLLNPWATSESNVALGLGGGAGGRFGGRRGRGSGGPAAAAPNESASGAWDQGMGQSVIEPNLDFLPEAGAVFPNLRPDANGFVRVPVKELGGAQFVQCVVVDGIDAAHSEIALAATDFTPDPRRLRRGLDPEGRFAETRRIEFVAAGQAARIDDVRSAEVGSLDSLRSVHRLFRALTNDSRLDRFEFTLRWPELDENERLDLYSKNACHELHLFLWFKDREFFDEIVAPYLANKGEKTFIDHWLLQDDLSGYLEPWAFGRLNVVEKALLARRLGEQGAGIGRRVGDRVALMKDDPQSVAALFFTVLGSDDLSRPGDEANGMAGQLGRLRNELQLLEAAREATKEDQQRQQGSADRRRSLRAAAKSRADRPSGPSTPGAGGPSSPGAPKPRRAPATGGVVADDKAPAEKGGEAIFGFDTEEAESEDFDAAGRDNEARKNVRRFYRAPERTKAYVEQNYFEVPMRDDTADRIAPNRFWLDFVTQGEGPFLSSHVASAVGSFSEMMIALAVLDLPFEAAEVATEIDGASMTMTPSQSLLFVRQELTEVEQAAAGTGSILVSQDFYRLDERTRIVDGETVDAWVTDEFVAGIAYGAQIVVTNPTSRARTIELLLQVPTGAIPLQSGLETESIPMLLQPYSTQSKVYSFYFPEAGQYAHYPVHVSSAGKSVAKASAFAFNVVDEPTVVDTNSWNWISQDAEPDQVLGHLEVANLFDIDLNRIAWRMKDKQFFLQTLTRLRARHVYAPSLWRYGYRHRDEQSIREHLRHQDGFLGRCGIAFRSDLITIDPVERRWHEQIEFKPLFNPRAHRFAGEYRILNDQFATQYQRFLSVLAHEAQPSANDWLGATYYLLLQDRIEDALAAFAKVDQAEIARKLQYDAIRAYLAFYQEDLTTARALAEQHRDHPVRHWRSLFREMLVHLDEAQGRAVVQPTEDDGQVDLVTTEPSLEFVVENGKLVIRHQNLEACELRFFPMDVEFLFSTRPFVQGGAGAFGFVRPNRVDRVSLKDQGPVVTLDLPEQFVGANVLIEARAEGVVRRAPVYANDLAVRWVENRGQLKVTDPDTGKPLSKVYVKVYGRQPDGSVRFHKDGYTDLRGRFDYVSLSGNGALTAERYSILVLDDERGAVIHEADAPVR